MPTRLDSADPLTLATAALVAVLAVARATRLVVHDDWPPMVWARQRYRAAVGYGQWEGLVTCPFCFAPWAALASLLWAWFGGLDPDTLSGGAWWLAHVWFAVAYTASMIVVRDEPPEED